MLRNGEEAEEEPTLALLNEVLSLNAQESAISGAAALNASPQ